jgi:hypothetical protein
MEVTMAKGNEPFIGDRVHHEGRLHPYKAGWFQANGEIVNLLQDEDTEDTLEVMVKFDNEDVQIYDVEELEWTNAMGGYWRVV